MPKRMWTDDEITRARELIMRPGATFSSVDKALGRHKGATSQKLKPMANGDDALQLAFAAAVEVANALRRTRMIGTKARRRAVMLPRSERGAREREQARKRYLAKAAGGGRDVPYEPPLYKRLDPNVLAERDHAFAQEKTLSQTYFGDPLPGRSALDRRGRV